MAGEPETPRRRRSDGRRAFDRVLLGNINDSLDLRDRVKRGVLRGRGFVEEEAASSGWSEVARRLAGEPEHVLFLVGSFQPYEANNGQTSSWEEFDWRQRPLCCRRTRTRVGGERVGSEVCRRSLDSPFATQRPGLHSVSSAWVE